MNVDEMAERLHTLESSVAHLERRSDALNDVVIEQGRVIHRLEKTVRRLSDALDQAELDRIRSTSSKPPHHQP